MEDEPRRSGDDLNVSDFDYELPESLIAQTPLENREDSRLLVLEKNSGHIHHSRFKHLGQMLAPGDLLVANNSRVNLARMHGIRDATGGAVEILLLREVDGTWSAMAKPASKLRAGAALTFPSLRGDVEPARGIVEENLGEGVVRLRFDPVANQRLSCYGVTPLPPYITQTLLDPDRYQTVYSSVSGSAAAPTAGLHFSLELIADLNRQGIGWTEVTLHVGLDTFRPIMVSRIRNHAIHEEWCEVSTEAARSVAECRQRGGRVVAVGTTAARTLETLGACWSDDTPQGFAGMTKIFIVPGHRWRLVDALVTNFHLPRSSLLLLVSALAGRESILHAYAEAIRQGYRFYSFGDAMLIR